MKFSGSTLALRVCSPGLKPSTSIQDNSASKRKEKKNSEKKDRLGYTPNI